MVERLTLANPMRMRIAVTGASGFLGRSLCPVLQARGHEVVALDRGQIGDFTAVPDWRPLIAGADAVVHLAAIAHRSNVTAARLSEVNRGVPLALGRAAAAAGARLLFMSSVKVHGEQTHVGAFDEASAYLPEDSYARAKAEAEMGLRAIPGLKLSVIRPPLVYGPGVKGNFLLLLRAVASGWPLPLAALENRRSFVYSGNLADAVARCVESPQAAGRSYLVCDGRARSTPELCGAIGVALGRPARLFPFPAHWLDLAESLGKLTQSLEVDDGAIRRELAWTPPHSFEAGLRETAAWFRTSHGARSAR